VPDGFVMYAMRLLFQHCFCFILPRSTFTCRFCRCRHVHILYRLCWSLFTSVQHTLSLFITLGICI